MPVYHDGSGDAQTAAGRAAKLFPGAPVTVLAVWKRYVEMVTQNGLGLAYAPSITDVEEIDAAVKEQARATVQEGAERLGHARMAASHASRHGAPASPPRSSPSRTRSTPTDRPRPRGRGAIKSLLLGSVSHDVV